MVDRSESERETVKCDFHYHTIQISARVLAVLILDYHEFTKIVEIVNLT
jgi:hypothetical protein